MLTIVLCMIQGRMFDLVNPTLKRPHLESLQKAGVIGKLLHGSEQGLVGFVGQKLQSDQGDQKGVQRTLLPLVNSL
jgi:hypothetical protein